MAQHSTSRPAFTLIEALVVISLGSLLFLLSIQLLHRSLTISSQSTQHLHQELTLSRLSRDFREDLWLARKSELTSNKELEIETRSGDQILWTVVERNRMTRKWTDDERSATEDYRLMEPIEIKLSYHQPAEEQLQTIHLEIRQRSPVGENVTKLLRKIQVVSSRPASPSDSTGTTIQEEAR
jgi:type II secretory pathway component PulJ